MDPQASTSSVVSDPIRFLDACPVGLSSERQTSTIPIAENAALPRHQGAVNERWMYPSEQQFYQAMERKVGPCFLFFIFENGGI